MLHVAALPFPTHQGTQAALHQMLEAEIESGSDAALLTYDEGQFAIEARYPRYLAGRPLRRSQFRSGPSLTKLRQDVALGRALHRRAEGQVVVAHHVEAALCALLDRVPDWVFFAHTSLTSELPGYRLWGVDRPWLWEALGGTLDGVLCKRAPRVVAVVPALVEELSASADRPVDYVPVPWPERLLGKPVGGAREKLRIPESVPVLGYSGNLDAYQGWEDLLEVLVLLPSAFLVVHTASDTCPLLERAVSGGVGTRVRVLPMKGEGTRKQWAAVTDVALVPRRLPGGVPIKLLDALARGLPVATVPRATGGLPLRHVVEVAADDSAVALAAAARKALRRPHEPEAGRAYLRKGHSATAFSEALWGGESMRRPIEFSTQC
ncbi:MAG: glycosyltransferase [Myxococcota bacterium]